MRLAEFPGVRRLLMGLLVVCLVSCAGPKDRCIDSGGAWNPETQTCLCLQYRDDGYCRSMLPDSKNQIEPDPSENEFEESPDE